MAIDTDVILKLFDTLKETNTNLVSKVEKQTEALVALGQKSDSIKTKLDTMIKSFDDHSKESSVSARTTSECTEETEEKVGLIWNAVSKMKKMLNTVIIVICVAFGLMAMSYYFVRGNIESMIDNKVEKSNPDSHEELVKEIEELRKQIKDLHP